MCVCVYVCVRTRASLCRGVAAVGSVGQFVALYYFARAQEELGGNERLDVYLYEEEDTCMS